MTSLQPAHHNRDGVSLETFSRADPYVREALIENKRQGLLFAVRARWVALAITAVFIPFLNFSLEILYYEAALAIFALIGWAQLRVGSVVKSRLELLLMFLDIALLTFVMVFPNPFSQHTEPTAYQYRLGEFGYFFIFLAAAALAYSWRTVIAYGIWTAAVWLVALGLVLLFGLEFPALSEATAIAYAGYDRILETIDPNDPFIAERIQEILIFVIVAGILAVNGRRNNDMVYRQANIARERGNLARHFPPTIVDQMADQDQPFQTTRSQEVAVMFLDIVGFTQLSERLGPEQTFVLLREFHGRMEQQVFDHHGTLDKFLGDGILATFGTPETTPQDAANALACAKAMLEEMERWNEERADQGAPRVQLSVGIHYGPVVIGDIGSERHLEYAVLGDSVNVASRLEAFTRQVSARLVVSDALVRATGDRNTALGLTSLGAQKIRGRDEPISLWQG